MDIDIDLEPNVDLKKIFPNITPASRKENGELKKHPVGYYFQTIPIDPLTQLAAIPFDKSEDFEYYKIDLLTLKMLQHFESKQEMLDLQKKEPKWSLLENEKVVKRLFHLGKHYDIVSKIKPRSIQEIADIFALIRPNKIGLLNKYIKQPDVIRKELFTKRDAKDMRKAHAIPYALLIVLQLHLIEQGRI